MTNAEGMILAREPPATAGRLRIDAKKISERKISKPFRIFRGQIVFLVSIGVLA